MTFVFPCSSGCVTLLTKSTFAQRRDIKLARYNGSRRPSNPSFSNHRLLLPKLATLRTLKKHLNGSHTRDASRFLLPKAVGADVTTEEQNSSVSDEGTSALPEKSSPAEEKCADETEETSSVSASGPPVTQSRRSRPARKSEMPPVNNEELVPGASFTGKIRSIQPFGAFVDFGAFTDGLVHVSKLSNGFVKDVADVVSVGQEVKVRIVEANMETGRISLSMRDDDSGKSQQRKESSDGGNKPRTDRRNNARSQRRNDSQVSKFTKGQALDGTVKNLTRAGAYISLPDGEEGFLPLAEESEGFGNILGSSNLQAGQEVNVRVLRISRGQVTLTMKKKEDVEAINKQLNQGVVHTASNPFMLAFRKNKDIAAFLDEREKSQESVKATEQLQEKVDVPLPNESGESQTQDLTSGSADTKSVVPSEVGIIVESSISSEVATDEAISDTMMSDKSVASTDHTKPQDSVGMEEDNKSQTPEFATDASSETNADTGSESSSQVAGEIKENTESLVSEDVPSQNDQAVSGTLSLEESVPSADSSEPEASMVTEEKLEASELAVDATSEPNAGTESDSSEVAELEENTEPLVPQKDGPVANSVGEEPLIVNDSGEASSGTESNAEVDGATLTPESSESETSVENQADSTVVDEKVEVQVCSLEGTAETTANAVTTETSQQQETNDSFSNEQISTTMENSAKATISPSLVKQLREESGAGMMDCKKALAETGGDIAKAQEFLRKNGLASADKKASRATAEGRIGSYIHDNRIGVLIEVNCETDFVSRGEIFKELVDDLAMQVAACPQVKYLVTEDVPEETVKKEREIEMQKEDLLSKPEQIREKIVDGRINKRLQEFALLEQPYIKNDKVVVKDWVKQTIATIGENIKVKRFIRYNLGEGLQKKSKDFAAEVAAQTAAKESLTVTKEQPVKTEETVQKPPSVAISAAMVKQLREETGAGMMNCKKALAETSGNLEAAQEYLRKKGLSSADKKSSRLAAEGRISSYIHDGRIGVLIEVNSETDFVARNEKFKELVDDLAMQVAACPHVQFVSLQEIPEGEVAKEKEIEMHREDLKLKPENIREKIVEGRVSKRLGELALLEQPFIKDDSVLVKDLVKQTVATLGENIRVRRFARFNLGE